MSHNQTHTPGLDNEARVGRRFEHSIATTGYNGPNGPEPVVYEITEVTPDGKILYGPVQRGIESKPSLWIWEYLFERDALGSWLD